jgi:hypothetical protein
MREGKGVGSVAHVFRVGAGCGVDRDLSASVGGGEQNEE